MTMLKASLVMMARTSSCAAKMLVPSWDSEQHFAGSSRVVRFGDFEVVPCRREVRRGRTRLRIRRKPIEVLLHLLANRHRIVTKAELLAAVWTGTHVSTEALTSAVRDLRRALDDNRSPHRTIVTVRGCGYFLAEGTSDDAEAPAPCRRDTFDGERARYGRGARSVSIAGALRVSMRAVLDGDGAGAFELTEEARKLGIDVYIGEPAGVAATACRSPIPLRALLANIAEGASVEQVASAFPGLRREQLRALIALFEP
jgi:DNA-binding winged helix-turn-helix (wHTH) protein